MDGIGLINKQLKEYLRKRQLILMGRGAYSTFGIGVVLLLTVSILEYFVWFDGPTRRLMYFSVLGCILVLLVLMVLWPMIKWLGFLFDKKVLAKEIGTSVTGIDDKLINLLELSQSNAKDMDLVKEAIARKSSDLNENKFSRAIAWNTIWKFWPMAIVPILVLGFVFISGNKDLVVQGANRLVNHKLVFEKPIPFDYTLDYPRTIEEGESFELNVSFIGEVLPSEVHIDFKDGAKERLKRFENGIWAVRKRGLIGKQKVEVYAENFLLEEIEVEVLEVPMYASMQMNIMPPKYTGLSDYNEKLKKVIQVLEGSNVKYGFAGLRADSLIWKSEGYRISTVNEELGINGVRGDVAYDIEMFYRSSKKGVVEDYRLEVIKDQKPELDLAFEWDSNRVNNLIISGLAEDDYGLTSCGVYKAINDRREKIAGWAIGGEKLSSINMEMDLDDIGFQNGDFIEVEVWDNDGVNGRKNTKVKWQISSYLSNKEREAKRDSMYNRVFGNSLKIRKDMDELIQKISEAVQKSGKSEMDWEKRKALQDELEKIEKEKKALDDSKKEVEKLEDDKAIKKELDEKEDIINKVLKELKELLNEDELSKLRQKLKDIEKKSETGLNEEMKDEALLKDLLFKRDMLKEIQRLGEMKRELNEDMAAQEKDAGQLEEEMEAHKEKMEELSEDNEVFPSEEDEEKYEEGKSQASEALEEMSKSQDQDNQNSSKAQKALEKMKESMESSLMAMQMQQQMENIEALRSILENIELFSHNIEAAGQETKQLENGDPRMRDVLLEKYELSLGFRVIKDSLTALAIRAPEIKEIVFKEVLDVENKLEEGLKQLQNTDFGKAAGSDQFGMMGANNLALLLDNSMQQMMANLSMMQGSEANCNKPGGTKPKPGQLGKMQGELGKKVNGLKGKGQGENGEGIGDGELGKILREQEAIRQAYEEAEGKENKGNGGNNGDLANDMKEVEKKLANKEIDAELMERIRKIESRLLKDERAMEKQEVSEQRESESSNLKQRELDGSKPKGDMRPQRIELLFEDLRTRPFYLR